MSNTYSILLYTIVLNIDGGEQPQQLTNPVIGTYFDPLTTVPYYGAIGDGFFDTSQSASIAGIASFLTQPPPTVAQVFDPIIMGKPRLAYNYYGVEFTGPLGISGDSNTTTVNNETIVLGGDNFIFDGQGYVTPDLSQFTPEYNVVDNIINLEIDDPNIAANPPLQGADR